MTTSSSTVLLAHMERLTARSRMAEYAFRSAPGRTSYQADRNLTPIGHGGDVGRERLF
jgi:hypothetical protein